MIRNKKDCLRAVFFIAIDILFGWVKRKDNNMRKEFDVEKFEKELIAVH